MMTPFQTAQDGDGWKPEVDTEDHNGTNGFAVHGDGSDAGYVASHSCLRDQLSNLTRQCWLTQCVR